jgi:hypothetical protein
MRIFRRFIMVQLSRIFRNQKSSFGEIIKNLSKNQFWNIVLFWFTCKVVSKGGKIHINFSLHKSIWLFRIKFINNFRDVFSFKISERIYVEINFFGRIITKFNATSLLRSLQNYMTFSYFTNFKTIILLKFYHLIRKFIS